METVTLRLTTHQARLLRVILIGAECDALTEAASTRDGQAKAYLSAEAEVAGQVKDALKVATLATV